MKKSRSCSLITIFVLIFLYLPMVLLVINSFNDSRFGGEWHGFTLKWYSKLLQETTLWVALGNSLFIGMAATIVSTVLGTLAAFSLHFYKTRFQKMHYGLIYTPLMIPDILMGIGLLLFFVTFHFEMGLFTIFIAHTTFCLSYVTMIMLSKLETFDFSILEAAQDLGANHWVVVRRILLPLFTPGIIAGGLLAFTLSFDDFVITYFVTGQGTSTLPVYIYNMMKFGSTPMINALSTIILFFTFISVAVTQVLSKDDE